MADYPWPQTLHPDRACPKCSTTGPIFLKTRHCSGQRSCDEFFYFSAALRESHLHRSCERCGYAWYELSMDFTEAKKLLCATCGMSPGAEWSRCDHLLCADCFAEGECLPCAFLESVFLTEVTNGKSPELVEGRPAPADLGPSDDSSEG